jgi:diguanylate cyclase (GGDEF)-like protein
VVRDAQLRDFSTRPFGATSAGRWTLHLTRVLAEEDFVGDDSDAGYRWLPGRAVVGLMSSLWALIAVDAVLVTHDHAPHVARPLPAELLLLLFIATSAFVVNVQLRREARSVFVSEVPLFLALLSLTPGQVVLVRALGAAIGFGLVRGQFRQPQKLLFNTSLAAAEGGLAVVVLQIVTRTDSPTPVLWLGGVLGASFASSFAALGVSTVIELMEGRPQWREPLRVAGGAFLISLPVTSVGCCVWAAWDDDPWAAVPLAVMAVVLLVGYRRYAVLREQHLALERLYRFNQVVSHSPQLDDVLATVLHQAREILHAEQARLTFVPGETGEGLEIVLGREGMVRTPGPSLERESWLLRRVLEEQVSVLVPRNTRDPHHRRWLERQGVRDCVLVPLMGEAGPVAVLAVENRMGDVRGFEHGEVQLLEAVAHQAAVALRNGELLEQLRHESLHDPLTGLPNRTNFQRDLEHRLAANHVGFAVGILDLDAFKDVNDTLGHQEGDRLLCEIAARMTTAVPIEGAVARLGGDEFAVLLPHCTTPADAMRAGERLLQALSTPVVLAGIEVDVSASLGLALVPDHGYAVGLLLRRADQAMYDAKHHGRLVRVFEPELDTGSPSKLALVAELRQAISQGEVSVHVQPKVNAVTGVRTGAEALARWHTPARGYVSPHDFVPLAERSGLIRPLTELVLGQAVAACAGWQRAYPGVGVAVNVSVRSLDDVSLVLLVDRLLRRNSLPAKLLTLEITESHIMSDPEAALETLQELRTRGVRLSIDDFGTGYSSLSYLRRLPVDEVKIDRSFVQRMATEPGDAAIVRSIVELARNMGLVVVAEGVEDDATWEALAEMGVDEIQGFVVSRPVPVGVFVGGNDVRSARVS